MYMFYIVNFVEARAIHSLNSESDFSHLSAKDITLPLSCQKSRTYMNHVLKKRRVMDDS